MVCMRKEAGGLGIKKAQEQNLASIFESGLKILAEGQLVFTGDSRTSSEQDRSQVSILIAIWIIISYN